MAKNPKSKAKAKPILPPSECQSGIPSPETIVVEGIVTSPKGTGYRVLRTTQVDGYEAPPSKTKRRSAK